MRIGKVIGTVTPGRIHPGLLGGQLKIVAPFSLDDLSGNNSDDVPPNEKEYSLDAAKKVLMSRSPKPAGTEVVVYDELSVGMGEWVAFSEGAEAAMPFYPNVKPVDAYAAAIIDTLEIDELGGT